jgi:hypothetical protein
MARVPCSGIVVPTHPVGLMDQLVDPLFGDFSSGRLPSVVFVSYCFELFFKLLEFGVVSSLTLVKLMVDKFTDLAD